MSNSELELDENLKGLLNQLRPVSPLDSQAVAEERAKFLAQGAIYRAAVPRGTHRRHNGWINSLFLAFRRKEPIPLLNTLMALVVTFSLLFGGAGLTVYAAQGSLPDDPLYAIKTWSEDTRLSLARNAETRLDLTLEFTNRRVIEVARQQAEGKPASTGAADRLDEELDSALQIAAGMEGAQMVRALQRIRLQAEAQSRTIAALMAAGDRQEQPILEQIQERLREQERLAETGEADPQGFRLLLRERNQNHQITPSQTPTQPDAALLEPGATPDPSGNHYGPGLEANQPSSTPGQYGQGEPNPSQSPSPQGGSYGPGPGGGQPTTTPGSYGPSPQSGEATRTPAQNGDGPGPGESIQTPQSNGPGPQHPGSIPQPVCSDPAPSGQGGGKP